MVISRGRELWRFETEHPFDAEARQMFRDIFSFRNELHWIGPELDAFLRTSGNMISICFTQPLPLGEDSIHLPALLTGRYAEKIEKIIVCLYGYRLLLVEADRILKSIAAHVPEKAETLMALFREKESASDTQVKVYGEDEDEVISGGFTPPDDAVVVKLLAVYRD